MQNAGLNEAQNLSDDLVLCYGLLSGDCENETEYIDQAEILTREIMRAEDWLLDDIFFGDPPDESEWLLTCKKILENIEQVKSIPVEKRNLDS